LLQNVSNAALATRGNIPAASQKAFVRIVDSNVASPYESAGAWLVGSTLTDIGADP
jgi:hypothetical protein